MLAEARAVENKALKTTEEAGVLAGRKAPTPPKEPGVSDDVARIDTEPIPAGGKSTTGDAAEAARLSQTQAAKDDVIDLAAYRESKLAKEVLDAKEDLEPTLVTQLSELFDDVAEETIVQRKKVVGGPDIRMVRSRATGNTGAPRRTASAPSSHGSRRIATAGRAPRAPAPGAAPSGKRAVTLKRATVQPMEGGGFKLHWNKVEADAVDFVGYTEGKIYWEQATIYLTRGREFVKTRRILDAILIDNDGLIEAAEFTTNKQLRESVRKRLQLEYQRELFEKAKEGYTILARPANHDGFFDISDAVQRTEQYPHWGKPKPE
jgi:hypothetical protein